MRSAHGFGEALALPDPAGAEDTPLAERLHAFSRLLALAADELAALEQGDHTKRRELSEARDELMQTMQEPASAEDAESDDLPPVSISLPDQLWSLISEALDSLEQRESEERRMQDRWSSLEGDALRAMHVGGRIVPLRAGRYPADTATESGLDVRF
jgi:hypothetical protein